MRTGDASFSTQCVVALEGMVIPVVQLHRSTLKKCDSIFMIFSKEGDKKCTKCNLGAWSSRENNSSRVPGGSCVLHISFNISTVLESKQVPAESWVSREWERKRKNRWLLRQKEIAEFKTRSKETRVSSYKMLNIRFQRCTNIPLVSCRHMQILLSTWVCNTRRCVSDNSPLISH